MRGWGLRVRLFFSTRVGPCPDRRLDLRAFLMVEGLRLFGRQELPTLCLVLVSVCATLFVFCRVFFLPGVPYHSAVFNSIVLFNFVGLVSLVRIAQRGRTFEALQSRQCRFIAEQRLFLACRADPSSYRIGDRAPPIAVSTGVCVHSLFGAHSAAHSHACVTGRGAPSRLHAPLEAIGSASVSAEEESLLADYRAGDAREPARDDAPRRALLDEARRCVINRRIIMLLIGAL